MKILLIEKRLRVVHKQIVQKKEILMMLCLRPRAFVFIIAKFCLLEKDFAAGAILIVCIL